MPRDEDTAADIVRAGRQALAFVEGMDRSTFDDDLKTQAAVQHQLLIIGEAVRRLSDEFKTKHPAVPWDDIRSMRNVLIHVYDHVDLGEVWRTVQRDIPPLLAELAAYEQDES